MFSNINVDEYRIVTGKTGNFLITSKYTDSNYGAYGTNIIGSTPTEKELKEFLISIVMEDLSIITFSGSITTRDLKNSEKNLLISEFEKMKIKFKNLLL